MPPINVNEGEIAQVCIEITNANLLDPVNPPTVMLATVESDSKTVNLHCVSLCVESFRCQIVD